MKLNGLIYNLPSELRNLIISFVIVLSTGYFVGVMFIDHTSSLNPQGIQDNYLGNEVTERIDVIKFKKSSYQMFNLIHTHVISMSIIFFIMGLLLSITDLNKYLKAFLIIEPFFLNCSNIPGDLLFVDRNPLDEIYNLYFISYNDIGIFC